MKTSQIALVLAALLAAPSLLFADFSYQETTQITGGSLLSVVKVAGAFSSQARHITDPVVSTTYLKGNRLARISPDGIEVIDLDKGTITNADPQKRTYTVMTFEQLREQAAAAMQKLREQQAQAQTQAPAATAPQPENNDVKTSFDVKVRKTGATQSLSGLQAEEAILTMMMNATDVKTSQSGAMGITDDLWLAPEPAGFGQIREFYGRMAEKMGNVFSGGGLDTSGGGANMSGLLANQPGAQEAMSNLAKQMRELKGMPVLQVMRMGMTMNGQPLPAASEAPLPANASPSGDGPNVGQIAKQDAQDSAVSQAARHMGSFGNFSNVAGGLGGFGHKKKAEQAPPPASAQTAPPTSAILLESKSESSNFSTEAVDDAHFDVPAGYRQIAVAGLAKSGN